MAGKILRAVHAGEDSLSYAILFLLVLLPVMEVVGRKAFQTGLNGSIDYTQHLVLVATFLAGAITSRAKKHLSMALEIPFKEPLKTALAGGVSVLSGSFALAFAWSSLSFAVNGFEAGQKVGVLPLRLVAAVIFVGYLAMGVRFITATKAGGPRGLRLLLAVLAGSVLAYPSILQFASTAAGAQPGFLAALGKPLQAAVSGAASPLIVVLIVSAFFGTPLFIVLGGAAFLLFARQGLPLEVVPNQAYAMLTGFSMAAIPLFTITGFLLSESKAGERLIRLFRSFFSWFPGGLAVMAIFVCAFFTTFTGASGVTIVALGGLLFYILTSAGYEKKFTVGLLTASGSIGLLFPPSLPVIIYGVTSRISIKEMYMGGILPGAAMVLTLVVIAMVYAARSGIERHAFDLREALAGVRVSVWEILLPVIIFVGYFGVRASALKRFGAGLIIILTVEHIMSARGRGRVPAASWIAVVPVAAVFAGLMVTPGGPWVWIGLGAWVAAALSLVIGGDGGEAQKGHGRLKPGLLFALTASGVLALLAAASSVTLTLVESAAVAALYTLVVQVFVHRDLKVSSLPTAMDKSLPIIGGTLTILALANALSYYIIDAEIPVKLTAWVVTAISSKYIFLLVVNLVLLVVGCFMDIYSAILVVAPLIIPLGGIFHVHPVHLGIIFLANMELGYLTPPVGLNLYLASYRFNEPMIRVYKDVQLFLCVHLGTVLLITYLPFLTTLLLKK
jgi:TRAP-type C4-dicarboxylate transport system permease large subunit/TRAP-type C4-dicarboxylate transport system permease small subunit